jgi:hypothetical protein
MVSYDERLGIMRRRVIDSISPSSPLKLYPPHPDTMAIMTMLSLDALGDPLTPFRPPEVISPAVVRHRPVEQPHSASFAVLPEEIIVKILEWCDFKGVLACQLVRGALVFGPIGSDTVNRTPSHPITLHSPSSRADMSRSQRCDRELHRLALQARAL